MIKKMNEDEKAKVETKGKYNQSGELSARRFLLPYGFAAPLVLELEHPDAAALEHVVLSTDIVGGRDCISRLQARPQREEPARDAD